MPRTDCVTVLSNMINVRLSVVQEHNKLLYFHPRQCLRVTQPNSEAHHECENTLYC